MILVPVDYPFFRQVLEHSWRYQKEELVVIMDQLMKIEGRIVKVLSRVREDVR